MNLYESLRQSEKLKNDIIAYIERDRESRESKVAELMMGAFGGGDEEGMKGELKELDVTIKWLEDTINKYQEENK